MLVLLAAFLHAGWNTIVKTASDRLLVISAVAMGQFLAGVLVIAFVPAVIGAALTSTGIASIAFIRKSALKNRAALFFAGGTGVIIAGYTVADGIGVRLSGRHIPRQTSCE